MLGRIGAFWGVFGVCLLLGNAVWHLSLVSYIAFDEHFSQITALHWILTLIWVPFMLFSEGYRGFHKQFSPRVVARAIYLKHNPTPTRVLLAPLFCMGYFYATRKRIIASWILTIAIIAVIMLIHVVFSEKPLERGLIDLGVVAGLAWGLISIGFFIAKAMIDTKFKYDPEVPKKVG